MNVTYRLEFLTKRPGAFKKSWSSFIREGVLTGEMGTFWGLFQDGDNLLDAALEKYRAEKNDDSVRLEVSSIVEYDDVDYEHCEVIKLYPPSVDIRLSVENVRHACTECGTIIPGSPGRGPTESEMGGMSGCIAFSIDGALLVREHLFSELGIEPCQDGWQTMGSGPWLVITEGPKYRWGKARVGWCNTCGRALGGEELPEPYEYYANSVIRSMAMSPGQPALPCFGKQAVAKLLRIDKGLSLERFKPVYMK